jgi:hypothetical protein
MIEALHAFSCSASNYMDCRIIVHYSASAAHDDAHPGQIAEALRQADAAWQGVMTA